jgi:hypothetical protein
MLSPLTEGFDTSEAVDAGPEEQAARVRLNTAARVIDRNVEYIDL